MFINAFIQTLHCTFQYFETLAAERKLMRESIALTAMASKVIYPLIGAQWTAVSCGMIPCELNASHVRAYPFICFSQCAIVTTAQSILQTDADGVKKAFNKAPSPQPKRPDF